MVYNTSDEYWHKGYIINYNKKEGYTVLFDNHNIIQYIYIYIYYFFFLFFLSFFFFPHLPFSSFFFFLSLILLSFIFYLIILLLLLYFIDILISPISITFYSHSFQIFPLIILPSGVYLIQHTISHYYV